MKHEGVKKPCSVLSGFRDKISVGLQTLRRMMGMKKKSEKNWEETLNLSIKFTICPLFFLSMLVLIHIYGYCHMLYTTPRCNTTRYNHLISPDIITRQLTQRFGVPPLPASVCWTFWAFWAFWA